MSSFPHRRDKLGLLLQREVGGFSTRSSVNNGSFEKQMLKAQVFGNKQHLRPSYYQKDVLGHFGCVNAVEFSHSPEEFLASGGDDKRVLLWKTSELFEKLDKPKVEVMKGRHESNIFCLAFTSDTEQLLSSGNDHTVFVHNLSCGAPVDVYILEEAVYSISVHPDTDRIFVTACEDGRVQMWDRRLPTTADALVIASHHAAFQSASFNPAEGRLIATANSRDGVQLWDVRRPKWCVTRYNVGQKHGSDVGLRNQRASCMCVRWDSRGERLLALRRREMPLLFHIGDSRPIAYFDHPGYYNSCTMKSCCFAGLNDEYVVTGSDNFSIYLWPTPSLDAGRFYDTGKEKPILINGAAWELKGHRSIVNQVRFSKTHHVLVASGVEKVIKLWSPWPMPGGRGFGKSRPLYTHQEYLNMVVREGGLSAAQDAQEARGALDEDPRMLAFFDSLVLREMDNSSSSDDSSDDDFGERIFGFVSDTTSGAESDGSGSRLRGRLRRRARILFNMTDADGSGPYSNVVVESESSPSTNLDSTPVSISSQSAESQPSSSSSNASDDDDRTTDTNDISTMSDPEFERHLFHVDSADGDRQNNIEASGEPGDALDSHQLDPALGYIPSSRPVFERDVTRLVIRKRRAANARMSGQRRYRSLSASVLPERASNRRGRQNTLNEDGLSRDEVRRRVEAAVAICRRGRSDAALRRLVRVGSRSSAENNDSNEVAPVFHFSSSSSSDDEGSSSTSMETERKKRKRKRVNKAETADGNDTSVQCSSGETFRKRPKAGPSAGSGASNASSPDKKRHYRRRMRSSSSSSVSNAG